MNLRAKLAPNFTLLEFVYSQTAYVKGIVNMPSEYAIENLKELATKIMQPIRENFQSPVIITSGFRNRKLNSLIGGSETSQHILGQACDFVVRGVDNKSVCDWIGENLEFDQLILEKSWVHVSYKKPNRKEFFVV